MTIQQMIDQVNTLHKQLIPLYDDRKSHANLDPEEVYHLKRRAEDFTNSVDGLFRMVRDA